MGEYADLILDGYVCEDCGESIENDLAGEGFPQLCSGCAKEHRNDGRKIISVAPDVFQDVTPLDYDPKPEKVACPECGKMVSPLGLAQHTKAKHEAE